MKKLDVYNNALASFNIAPLEELLKGDDRSTEQRVLDRMYLRAFRKASQEYQWSFLIHVAELGADNGPVMGYQHSYKLPDGVLYVINAGGRYKRVGDGLLLSDGPSTILVVMDEPPDEGVPEDFWDIVSLALAFFSANVLAPGDANVKEAIIQDYREIFIPMRNNDIMMASKDFSNDYEETDGDREISLFDR